MCGFGLPVAEQDKMTGWPASVVMFVGDSFALVCIDLDDVIVGGTENTS